MQECGLLKNSRNGSRCEGAVIVSMSTTCERMVGLALNVWEKKQNHHTSRSTLYVILSFTSAGRKGRMIC